MLNTPSVWNVRIISIFVYNLLFPICIACTDDWYLFDLMIDGMEAVWILDLQFSLERVWVRYSMKSLLKADRGEKE